MAIWTGYFGPEQIGNARGDIHVVVESDAGRKPICGTHISDARFNVCGRGVHAGVLDCDQCRAEIDANPASWIGAQA